MTVIIFTCDGSALPTPCTITVPKQERCRDLVQALGYACSLKPSEKLVLVEICCVLLNVIIMDFHWTALIKLIELETLQVHNHLIQRFLEDPLISLSTIKDDEHLATYKTPKLLKNTKYFQLIHRPRQLL